MEIGPVLERQWVRWAAFGDGAVFPVGPAGAPIAVPPVWRGGPPDAARLVFEVKESRDDAVWSSARGARPARARRRRASRSK